MPSPRRLPTVSALSRTAGGPTRGVRAVTTERRLLAAGVPACGIPRRVSPPSAPVAVHLLYGRHHEDYAALELSTISDNTAATISVGSDVKFIRHSAAKYNVNEDALLVLEDDRHTVLCVADAHFGRESSEDLIATLAGALIPVPQNASQLDDVLQELASREKGERYASETTLLICIYDRLFKQAFGISFGDSSLVHIGTGGAATLVNTKSGDFVSPATPSSLNPDTADRFALSLEAGELLIAYTDGIDECCYRDPDRSITLAILAETVQKSGGAPDAVAVELTRLALTGVDGQPGGQDNIVLAVTRA